MIQRAISVTGEELFIIKGSIHLRHCSECLNLVAYNRFVPGNQIRPEVYRCLARDKMIDDPDEHVICDRFRTRYDRSGNLIESKDRTRCEACDYLFRWIEFGFEDGIVGWRDQCECMSEPRNEIIRPEIARYCSDQDPDEPEETGWRVTFVAYQTVEVEAENKAEAISKAWDMCELSDAEIEDVKEVERWGSF